LGSDKFKNDHFRVKFCQKVALKKVDGSWFFWSDFLLFWSFWAAIGFIEKQAPQKALCLGPDPPPEILLKIIDFYDILSILGSSIEPEKASLKSASTPYPPWKEKFIGVLIIRDPILGIVLLFHFGPWHFIFYSSIFWCSVEFATLVFLVYFSLVVCFSLVMALLWLLKTTRPKSNTVPTVKKGKSQYTGAVAGNLSRPEPRWV
jgi:hypothetical protein